MFQRLLLAFSLIVSFGVAQIGAVTHEISHYSDTKSHSLPQDFNKNSERSTQNGSQNDLTPDNQVPHNQVCEKCFSYAELGHAVQNAAITWASAISSQQYANTDSATFSYAKLRSYSARAPPSFA